MGDPVAYLGGVQRSQLVGYLGSSPLLIAEIAAAGHGEPCPVPLPVHHRSSIYAPATRSVAPICSWGLRLCPWEGKDLLHGLVRIEVAPENSVEDYLRARHI
jgi:hypothetical protein